MGSICRPRSQDATLCTTSTSTNRRSATSLPRQQTGWISNPEEITFFNLSSSDVKKVMVSRRLRASLMTRMSPEEDFSATQNLRTLTRILDQRDLVGFLRTLGNGFWPKTGWPLLKGSQNYILLACSARGRSLAKNLTSSRSSSQFSEERGPARNWNAAKNAGSIVKSSGNTFRSINDK